MAQALGALLFDARRAAGAGQNLAEVGVADRHVDPQEAGVVAARAGRRLVGLSA